MAEPSLAYGSAAVPRTAVEQPAWNAHRAVASQQQVGCCLLYLISLFFFFFNLFCLAVDGWIKNKKEESPCFRDHVVFPSLR